MPISVTINAGNDPAVEGIDYSFSAITGVYEIGSDGYDRSGPGDPIPGTPSINTVTATLDDGSTVALGSNTSGFDPLLLVGVGNDGGDPASPSHGILEVSNASTLVFTGQNQSDQGAGLIAGGIGGMGSIEVTNGGELLIHDPAHDNGTVAADFGNAEFLSIGESGGTGEMLVDGATSRVEVVGGFAYFGIGTRGLNAGGEGEVTLSDGATVEVHDISQSTDGVGTIRSRGGTQIGMGAGSVGTLNIDSSAKLNINSDHGGTFFEAGFDGGEGNVNLTDGQITLGASNFFASMSFGGRGGTGNLTATGSTLEIASDANFAGFQIGQDDGIGEATLTDTTVNVSTGDGYARIGVGFADDNNTGGTGDLIASGSDLSATNLDGDAQFVIGDGEDTNGEAQLNSDSSVEVTATQWAGVVVGRGENAIGELSFDDGSSLVISGGSIVDPDPNDNYGASAEIGSEGGNGIASFEDGSTFDVTSTAADSHASIQIGWNAGVGRLELSTGAVTEVSGGRRASINVGGAWEDFNGDGGNGTLVVDAAELNLTASGGDAEAAIGMGDGGLGTATFDDAAFSVASNGAAGRANLIVGWNGATGTVEFLNGTQAALTSDLNAGLQIGGKWDDFDGDGGTGTVDIDGTGTLLAMTALGEEGAFINVGRDGGDGTLNVTDGAELTAHTDDADGNSNMKIGATEAGGDAGDGTVVISSGGKILMSQTSNAGSVHVGGNNGGSGLLRVLSGGVLELSDDASREGVLRIGAEDGGTAEVEISGANSIITNLHYVAVGHRSDDNTSEAGRVGSLRIFGGGTLAANDEDGFIGFGEGGTLRGGQGNGTLIGEVEFRNGGGIDMRDGVFGSLTFEDGAVMQGNVTANVRLDVGGAGNDRLIVNDQFVNNSGVALSLTAVGGYKFAKGHQKVLATFNGGVGGDDDVAVTVGGQQADFSYYVGQVGANAANVVLLALNSGTAASAANAGVLDYGTAGAGKLVYNAVTQQGTVTGGKFGVEGGVAVKLDDIRGTNGVDNFSVTGATARTLKFDGKGGNDIIKGGAGSDTMLGGIGNDTLTGNAGNDILQGDVGKDTMTGNAGSDTFKFTLKTHSSASHATADIITDFDDGGTGDKIDVSALFGPKMEYIHAAAFTKAGQVRINDIAGADVIVEVNLTGVSGADFAIRLKATTLASMGKDDFVL